MLLKATGRNEFTCDAVLPKATGRNEFTCDAVLPRLQRSSRF